MVALSTQFGLCVLILKSTWWMLVLQSHMLYQNGWTRMERKPANLISLAWSLRMNFTIQHISRFIIIYYKQWYRTRATYNLDIIVIELTLPELTTINFHDNRDDIQSNWYVNTEKWNTPYCQIDVELYEEVNMKVLLWFKPGKIIQINLVFSMSAKSFNSNGIDVSLSDTAFPSLMSCIRLSIKDDNLVS